MDLLWKKRFGYAFSLLLLGLGVDRSLGFFQVLQDSINGKHKNNSEFKDRDSLVEEFVVIIESTAGRNILDLDWFPEPLLKCCQLTGGAVITEGNLSLLTLISDLDEGDGSICVLPKLENEGAAVPWIFWDTSVSVIKLAALGVSLVDTSHICQVEGGQNVGHCCVMGTVDNPLHISVMKSSVHVMNSVLQKIRRCCSDLLFTVKQIDVQIQHIYELQVSFVRLMVENGESWFAQVSCCLEIVKVFACFLEGDGLVQNLWKLVKSIFQVLVIVDLLNKAGSLIF